MAEKLSPIASSDRSRRYPQTPCISAKEAASPERIPNSVTEAWWPEVGERPDAVCARLAAH